MVGDEKIIMVERCLLGHIISDNSLISSVNGSRIDSKDFIDLDCGKLLDALKSILPLSSGDVFLGLHQKYSNQFGKLALNLLTERFHFSFDSCLQAVIENANKKSVLSDLTAAYSRIASGHQSMKYEEILSELSRVISSDRIENNFNDVLIYKEVIRNYIDELEATVLNARNGIMPGITTGITELNDMIYGWTPGTYSIVAARTSMGKTTLALNFADAALMAGKKVLFFTNEMKATKLAAKHISNRARVRGPALNLGTVTDEEISRIQASVEQICELPFYINQKSGRSFSRFEHVVRFSKRKLGIDMVIIDYIQQLYPDDGKRYGSRLAELTHISAGMQELSQTLNIPIICLAQLNRQAEGTDQEPTISQLRDCGAFEQDADNVILIHRDKKIKPNAQGEVPGQLIIGKSRFGKTGFCSIMINFAFNKFR